MAEVAAEAILAQAVVAALVAAAVVMAEDAEIADHVASADLVRRLQLQAPVQVRHRVQQLLRVNVPSVPSADHVEAAASADHVVAKVKQASRENRVSKRAEAGNQQEHVATGAAGHVVKANQENQVSQQARQRVNQIRMVLNTRTVKTGTANTNLKKVRDQVVQTLQQQRKRRQRRRTKLLARKLADS